MRDILRPGLVLLLITMIAGVCLGFAYDITKDPIEQSRAKAKSDALTELMPSAEEFKEDVEIPADTPVDSVVSAYAGSDRIGYVIGVSSVGYSSTLEILVGIDLDGVIEGIKIVSQAETPGLGANCQKPEFYGQFAGKSQALSVTKSGAPAENEINAITSSTITSNAVTDGVNNALEFFQNNLK